MYTLFALTAPRDQNDAVDVRLRREMEWLVPLVAALVSISPLFRPLGLISQDTQSWINAKIAEYEADDDGIPQQLIEEFDRLSADDRVTILDNPRAFADLTLDTIRKMRADGYDGNRIAATTGGTGVAGSLTRINYDKPHDRGVLSIELPMRDKEDIWFSDPSIMRTMLEAVVAHAPDPLWACAYPKMYVGMQKNLFQNRRNFGWMGYTAEPLTEPGPLLAVSSVGNGTFMQLKPSMMTLHEADVEQCNEAEAYLCDKGVLPLM